MTTLPEYAIIDLRSDTVTQPGAAMREAMATAVVGDDVFEDDPTIIQLEERTAALLGKEAALYVASGTMANQVALRCHTRPGDELLLEGSSHMYWYEAGGPAALSGVTCRLLPGERGLFTAAAVRAALRPENVHYPPSRLLAVENTHNRGGGTIWPLERIVEVCQAAREAGLAIHLDGARLWNAAIATGIAEAEYAGPFDSVSVCFSKGLGAPVGSVLAGSVQFIHTARRVRKQLGGGMRQAGIIAAGALWALEHNRERLAEDHANAARLAAGAATIPGLTVNLAAVQTNMVYLGTGEQPAARICELMRGEGVLMLPTAPHTLRAVTSLAVDAVAIDKALNVIETVISKVDAG